VFQKAKIMISTENPTKSPSMSFGEVNKYLKSKLTKPQKIDPALYIESGTYPLSLIPYKIKDHKQLQINDESFSLNPTDLYKEIILEDGDSYFIINNQIKDEKSYYNSHEKTMRIGYGKNPIYTDRLYQLPWCEKFERADDDRQGWWDECLNSARAIKNKYQDVAVIMSGGIDSELIACAFLDAGIPFRPYCMKYMSSNKKLLNDYEFKYAVQFCEKYDLKLETEEIYVIDDICDRRHLDYIIDEVLETYFFLPALYTHHYAVEKFNKLGFAPVLGQNQVEIKLDENNKPSLGYHWLDSPSTFWAQEKGYVNIYDFFLYTPNQLLSYLDIPEVQNTTRVEYDFKVAITKKYGSKKILDCVRTKSSGYENVKQAMEKIEKQYHGYTCELIDKMDWSKRPMTQYIHNIDHILQNNEMCQYKILRTTTKDFLSGGFKQGVSDYYDLL